MKRKALFLTLFFCFLIGSPVWKSQAEFYGTPPTGLLTIGERHTYYLFVPTDYSAERMWPLLFLIGRDAQDPKEIIDSWVEWAKQNHFLILVPSIFPREGTVPAELEQWLLKIKREVTERYRIKPSQVLLVGFESGARYAAYLGLRHPEEFSAAALVRWGWPGSLEKLTKPTSDPEKQISFYLALDPQGEEFSRSEQWAIQLEKKGYPMTFEPLKADEDFLKLRDRMIQWFHKNADSRQMGKRPRKEKRGIFAEFIHNVFGM